MKFDSMTASALIGMRMMNGGYVSRTEFDDILRMVREERAQNNH